MKTRRYAVALSALALAAASFAASAADHSFSNTIQINVPDSGVANPYPSTINASGMSGNVTSVRVTLRNMFHSFPDDLDIIVQAPNGQQMLLMSDVGGTNDLGDVTLTFSATASSGLPDAGAFGSGTYLPTNFNNTTSEAISNTDLTVFNGPVSNATGTWSLFVVDDLGVDSGSIQGGWTLEITTDQVLPPATTCASEGYTGTKLTWCKNICENGLTGQTLDTWIHRWINRYRDLPYCAQEGGGEEPELPPLG